MSRTNVYVAAQLIIHDPERYEHYVSRFPETIEPFGGRLLAADDAAAVLEGSWPYQKFVLIEFPSEDASRRWALSPQYKAIAVDRKASTETTAVLIRGVS